MSRGFRRTAGAILLAAVTLFGSGCFRTPTGPKMGKVSGIVKYNGQPLGGAYVTFIAATPGVSRFGSGTTNDEGEFLLTTFKANDGAIVGEYLVTVIKQDLAGLPKGEDISSGKPIKPLKMLVPIKYTNPKTTPFRQSVEEGENSVTLDLLD